MSEICELCRKRKAKRFCPAVHGRICSQCCGESRERTLDCPPSCLYLQQAHQQDRLRVAGKREVPDPFPQVSVRQQVLDEQGGLLLGLSFALAGSARSDQSIRDSDLIQALVSVAQSYETLVNSGLYYEAPLSSRVHQGIAGRLESMIGEYRRRQQEHAGLAPPRDSAVLELLVFLTRMAQLYSSGRPKARGFVDFLLDRFPEQPTAMAPNEAAPGRIVMP